MRYGGTWDKFIENLHELKKDFSTINFNLVWFVLNGSSILECIEFLQGQGLHENTFIVNPLEYPDVWHISNLSDKTLDKIRNQINDKLKTTDPKYSLYNSLQLMLNYINIPFNKNIGETIKELTKIDQRRNLDSSKIFTEIYNNQGN